MKSIGEHVEVSPCHLPPWVVGIVVFLSLAASHRFLLASALRLLICSGIHVLVMKLT